MSDALKLGLAGVGTVGSGLLRLLAARKALQVHGAIGYTVEYDLHMWMKRAWALAAAWGDAAWHRARIKNAVLEGKGSTNA